MGSIRKRLEILESATVKSAELKDWTYVVEIRAGGSVEYAENVITGERDKGYYLEALRRDKSYSAIEVVIGKPSAQSVEAQEAVSG